MTTAPILVFLHGVGDGDQDDKWKATLSESLVRLGYPGLESAEVVAPKYAHALKDWDVRETLPDYTGKAPTREAAKTNRRAFESRMGAVEWRLGKHARGNGLLGLDTAVSAAVAVPYFKQARNYLSNPQIRAQVLNRVLNALPSTGRIVLVGHSLGSVIAADLLRRLPAGVEVVGMVTIGSPLANGAFDVDKLKDGLKEPPLTSPGGSTSGTRRTPSRLTAGCRPCSRGWWTSASPRLRHSSEGTSPRSTWDQTLSAPRSGTPCSAPCRPSSRRWRGCRHPSRSG
nr:hypothetical protein GCM10025699_56310 [Microbacterium flavescens]